ncbi:hypothetical protein [Micromonospora echinofusca]|uniref:Uncharacterized protein n=1 Tax=Micromonospora echinofusca TaxID=47858 RepID=A0ABS3VLR8_MICEH|nr:hypothetical protein [Micromonospora echinofusca]MBO4205454.1 hypothetical protein [Micromonospora echinofusca]
MPQPRPEVRTARKGHRRLAGKILISLATALVVLAFSTLVPADRRPEVLWITGTALFIGGAMFVVLHLLDAERQSDRLVRAIDDHRDQVVEKLTEGFSRIRLDNELVDLRTVSQLDPAEINQIVELIHYRTRIAREATPLVRGFARAEVDRLTEQLRRIGDRSDVTYEGEDREWLLLLTRIAHHSIRATSLSSIDAGVRGFDGGLWRGELGRRYLGRQAQAIHRGVQIQRLFIIDRGDLTEQDLLNDLRLHLEIGVEVRVLNANDAPQLRETLRDFIIFDEELSFQSTGAPMVGQHYASIMDTTLVTNHERIRSRVEEFNNLWPAPGVQVATLDADGRVLLSEV